MEAQQEAQVPLCVDEGGRETAEVWRGHRLLVGLRRGARHDTTEEDPYCTRANYTIALDHVLGWTHLEFIK